MKEETDDTFDDFYDDIENDEHDEHELEFLEVPGRKIFRRRIELLTEQKWLKDQLRDMEDW